MRKYKYAPLYVAGLNSLYSLSLQSNAAILKHRLSIHFQSCYIFVGTDIYISEHTRKIVHVEMYTLIGRESRLSLALAIGHAVLHPPGKISDN